MNADVPIRPAPDGQAALRVPAATREAVAA